MSSQGQVRFCACGTRLASDNHGARCGPCQHRRASGLGGAPVVPAEFWVSDRMSAAFTSRHMGNVIYAFRTHPWHGGAISQAVVAGWAGASQCLVSRIESGPPLRDLDRLTHWARVLRIPARLLWFELDIPGTADGLPGEGKPGHPVAMLDEVSPSRRREFVASGGLAAAGGLAVASGLFASGSRAAGGSPPAGGLTAGSALDSLDRELDLTHIALDRGTTSEERTAYFEQVAGDLGVQVAEVAPATLVKPTLGALRSIRALLEQRQPTSQQIRLVRAGAMISRVAGDVMFGIGQVPRARAWNQAADKAAADAGDRYLLDIALGGQAVLLIYSDNPKGALRLVSPRLDGSTSPSPAIARLWGLKARAHAALGEASEFSRSTESARRALDNSRPELICPGIFSCTPATLDFAEATGAVRLRRPATAISAADRALLSDLRGSDRTLTRLEHASALAQSGEVDQACREATDTLIDPGTQHKTSTRTYAHAFNEIIKGINSPATREWHQVHAEKHGQKRSPA